MDELEFYQGTHTGAKIDRDLDFVDKAFDRQEGGGGVTNVAVIPAVEYGGDDVLLYQVSYDAISFSELSGPTVFAMRSVVVDALKNVNNLAEHKCVRVSISGVSSLPVTVNEYALMSAPVINGDLVLVNAILSNPAAQTGEWTIETSTRSLTISGGISGTTDITLFLAVPIAPLLMLT